MCTDSDDGANKVLRNYLPVVQALGFTEINLKYPKQGEPTRIFSFKKEKEVAAIWKWGKNNKVEKYDYVCGYLNTSVIHTEVARHLVSHKHDLTALIALMGLAEPVAGVKGELAPAFQLHPKHWLTEDEAKEVQAHISRISSVYEAGIQRLKALEHGRKSAIAAIMARNMSHNLGSHVLSGFKLDETSAKGAQANYLNHYLQKRMDLIAGVTSGWEGAPEDMWFHSELIRGFLRNTALLDFIVQTYGYDHNKIVFKVDDVEYRYNRGEYKPSKGIIDFLVAIPNGVIGAQAVYVIFENAIRNAAKYTQSKNELVVEIGHEFCPKDNANLIKLSETLSRWNIVSESGENRDIVAEINEDIAGEIIQESGAPITEKLGIAEIRIAAEYLVGSGNEKLSSELENKSGAKVKRAIWCKKSGDGFEYQFHLQAPKNLLMVVKKSEKASLTPPDGLGVRITDDVNDLLKPDANHKIAYIRSTDMNPQELVDWLADNHWRLPYRLLIANRLVVAENLFPKKRFWMREKTVESAESLSGADSTQLYRQFVLRLYREWIEQKWGKKISDIQVLLGLHNEYDAWKSVSGGNLHIFQTNETPAILQGDTAWLKKVASSKCQHIVYDRHGEVTKWIKLANKSVIPENFICHAIGQKNSAQKLGDTFATPPPDPFVRELFILMLIESALTRVLIVDERVVEGLVHSVDGEIMERPANDIISRGNFEKELKISVPFKLAINEKELLVSDVVKNISNPTCLRLPSWQYGETATSEFDVIVFHQGTIDKLASLFDSEWFAEAFNAAPYFVVTSGRGKYIRHLDGYADLPFVQISAIKENLIDSVSKYHFVRSLASAKGGA